MELFCWIYCFVGIIVDSTSNVAFALWKEINFLIILWWSFKDPNDQEVWTVKFQILLTPGCRRWPPQCGWRTGPARRSPRAPPQGQGQAGMRGFRMFFFGFIVNAKFPCPLKICIQIYKVFLCIFNFFQMQCWHVFICIKIDMQGFHFLATWYNPRVSTRLLFARRITLLLYLVWNTSVLVFAAVFLLLLFWNHQKPPVSLQCSMSDPVLNLWYLPDGDRLCFRRLCLESKNFRKINRS